MVKAAENARKDHEYRKNLQVKNLTSNYLFWQHSKHGYITYTLITSSGNIENRYKTLKLTTKPLLATYSKHRYKTHTLTTSIGNIGNACRQKYTRKLNIPLLGSIGIGSRGIIVMVAIFD